MAGGYLLAGSAVEEADTAKVVNHDGRSGINTVDRESAGARYADREVGSFYFGNACYAAGR
ncbi:hypothetical protein IMSAG192_01258 [Muribaculaceae bacterium]|nr:hypothetical protein IMSAG192_01258 [Muribaculaceae bacterium]